MTKILRSIRNITPHAIPADTTKMSNFQALKLIKYETTKPPNNIEDENNTPSTPCRDSKEINITLINALIYFFSYAAKYVPK